MTDLFTPLDLAGRVDADDQDPADLDGAFVVRDLVRVTHDVTTFELEALEPRRHTFVAGQYLTVGLDIDGVPHERCYTISSPPTRPDSVCVTVKRVPGGPVSTWLHDHLAVGDRVEARGPLGRFTLPERARRGEGRYLFLSAGSGITPLMSMTRTLYDEQVDADVVFVHSARTPADIVFRDELDTLAATVPGLEVTAICEAEAPDEAWPGIHGRLSLEVLTALAPDLREREVFTCGPAPYMAAVRALLAEAGVDPARCHEESFSIEGSRGGVAVGLEARTSTSEARTGFTVELAASGRRIACPEGTTLLEAALQAGVSMPSSCGEGMCGTCVTTLVTGSVDMNHQGGIRPKEVAAGKILPCCSVPLEDVVLDA